MPFCIERDLREHSSGVCDEFHLAITGARVTLDGVGSYRIEGERRRRRTREPAPHFARTQRHHRRRQHPRVGPSERLRTAQGRAALRHHPGTLAAAAVLERARRDGGDGAPTGPRAHRDSRAMGGRPRRHQAEGQTHRPVGAQLPARGSACRAGACRAHAAGPSPSHRRHRMPLSTLQRGGTGRGWPPAAGTGVKAGKSVYCTPHATQHLATLQRKKDARRARHRAEADAR
jgi:hypothetical protein